MSSNLKGTNAIVRLLLGHGEKLWMVGIVACAGLLVWSALGCERLESNKAPQNLQKLISDANSHIQEFSWEGASPEKVLQASSVSSEAMKPIPHEHFPAFDRDFDTQVLESAKQRTDPELLAVLDLEAYGDSGIIATSTRESRDAKRLALQAEVEQKAQDRARKRNPLFDEEPASEARGSGHRCQIWWCHCRANSFYGYRPRI